MEFAGGDGAVFDSFGASSVVRLAKNDNVFTSTDLNLRMIADFFANILLFLKYWALQKCANLVELD